MSQGSLWRVPSYLLHHNHFCCPGSLPIDQLEVEKSFRGTMQSRFGRVQWKMWVLEYTVYPTALFNEYTHSSLYFQSDQICQFVNRIMFQFTNKDYSWSGSSTTTLPSQPHMPRGEGEWGTLYPASTSRWTAQRGRNTGREFNRKILIFISWLHSDGLNSGPSLAEIFFCLH